MLAAPMAAALDPPAARAETGAAPSTTPSVFAPPWHDPASSGTAGHGGPEGGPAALASDTERDLARELEAYRAEITGDFSVAAVELDSGTAFGYRADEPFTPGSVVKLDILTILLLKAQSDGRPLDEAERALARAAIGFSDNDAADGLFERIGTYAGFQEGRGRLGLADAGERFGGRWGLASTTARERLTLLSILYTDEGPLAPEYRETARGFLSGVAPEQAWGVSAADRGGGAELKNGWVPVESDGGRWAVNSTGRIVADDGRTYLVAVLSSGHPGYGSGVECTEHVAEAVVDAMAADIARQAPRGPVGSA
ncbi:hypothetical protein O4J56_05620 [Nocardiopsis sp. RSe5-2]|uniref:Serine hydrolase n=1 Tax=Nocardiopsis endophytica TaxID=3018445 RepID=A0ABT4U0V0_9ACTN|nr:hypothetical protein [Nocardiopsis endophytica]MDA2810110.1 hypothetical protein [Nocardiopsis endophytica]